jgi:hypothetical protein
VRAIGLTREVRTIVSMAIESVFALAYLVLATLIFWRKRPTSWYRWARLS